MTKPPRNPLKDVISREILFFIGFIADEVTKNVVSQPSDDEDDDLDYDDAEASANGPLSY